MSGFEAPFDDHDVFPEDQVLHDVTVTELHPFLVRVDVVKKPDPSKTLQAHILDVRHSIVCVQGLLEVKLCFARVNANELQPEFGTKRDPVHKATLFRPPAPGLLIALNKHSHSDSGIILDD